MVQLRLDYRLCVDYVEWGWHLLLHHAQWPRPAKVRLHGICLSNGSVECRPRTLAARDYRAPGGGNIKGMKNMRVRVLIAAEMWGS